MKTHVYTFNCEMRRQTGGGAIGLEMTGEIAGVFMIWWDRQLKQRLEDESVTVLMYKRYVDDINVVVKAKKDKIDKKIIERIKGIGDQIHKSIKLEADYPFNHENEKNTHTRFEGVGERK